MDHFLLFSLQALGALCAVLCGLYFGYRFVSLSFKLENYKIKKMFILGTFLGFFIDGYDAEGMKLKNKFFGSLFMVVIAGVIGIPLIMKIANTLPQQ